MANEDHQVPEVPKKRGRGRPPKNRSLPVAPPPAPKREEPAARAAVPAKPPQAGLDRVANSPRRATIFEAFAQIVEPETRGEAARVGFLGDSGSGKSSAIKRLLPHDPRESVTLIHDDTKINAQYEGQVLGVADLAGASDDGRVVIFRGDPFAGTTVEVNDVARLAVQLARARVKVRLVVDELDRVLTPGGRELLRTDEAGPFAPSPFHVSLTQGRALGLSVFWSTQGPHRTPREVIDQATAILLFRLGPRALSYLDGSMFFDPALLKTIPNLAVPEDGSTVSEFVLWRPGRPWDGAIYAFDVAK